MFSGRVSLKLRNQPVIGDRLAEPKPGEKRDQEQQGHDGDVVRSRSDFPKLMPVHKTVIAEAPRKVFDPVSFQS